MPESLVMYYAIEILKIVEAMHESGFIHGDIKPDNFLLRDKDSAEMAESVISASSVRVKINMMNVLMLT